MVLLYMVTVTINIPPMLVYIPYMDPMGTCFEIENPLFFATLRMDSIRGTQMPFLDAGCHQGTREDPDTCPLGTPSYLQLTLW